MVILPQDYARPFAMLLTLTKTTAHRDAFRYAHPILIIMLIYRHPHVSAIAQMASTHLTPPLEYVLHHVLRGSHLKMILTTDVLQSAHFLTTLIIALTNVCRNAHPLPIITLIIKLVRAWILAQHQLLLGNG